MTNREEQAYIRGRESGLAKILQVVTAELAYENRTLADLSVELKETRNALRSLCEFIGCDVDNDDSRYLPDIINKTIIRRCSEMIDIE